jgi:Family of unknown function (DUF6934)
MRLPRYPLASDETMTTFRFISEGPKGKIPKLAFGDENEENGEIDDLIVSNNEDSEQVLATVVATVYAFTDKNPEAWIYATGSTPIRTRLYRMGITKYIQEVKEDFEVFGETESKWESFKKGKDYFGFLVTRKKT